MAIIKASLYPFHVDLLVAFREDPAGLNMANHIASDMKGFGSEFFGPLYDLLIIDTPSISADWLAEKKGYDACVFLSKHAAESGRLALTCHSTGNFDKALYGGNERQVAVPYYGFQKKYMQILWNKRDQFNKFHITVEATHHGPTALEIPSIFVEVGTTSLQWNDQHLCARVADVVREAYNTHHVAPYAICFGGTHYPEKFTKMLLEGEYALGTMVPKHALEHIDEEMFLHILERNPGVKVALVDSAGLGKFKAGIVSMIEKFGLEAIWL
ncbi:MAG: D-aminoacyl-tRNA deacylase [Cenarchaeum symbiont of Oopsacas minuta]|nr:D-aminoacyl-tRNA deacylase [Cenarchaeum symbiont of Oopsacas minuta]